MTLSDGPPEESFTAVAGRSSIVFPGGPVAANRARLALADHGRRVHVRRVDRLQISRFPVYRHRHAVEFGFCCNLYFVSSQHVIIIVIMSNGNNYNNTNNNKNHYNDTIIDVDEFRKKI